MSFPDMEKFRPIYNDNAGMKIFLVSFIVFGVFAIVSLLTGVISESMHEKSRARQEERRADKEKGRALFVEECRRLMRDHDEDGKGLLSRLQFDGCKQEVLQLCHGQYMNLHV